VHADQDVVAVADVAADQSDVLDVVVDAGVSDGMELAVDGTAGTVTVISDGQP